MTASWFTIPNSLFYHADGEFIITHSTGFQSVGIVHVVCLIGQEKCYNNTYDQNRRYNVAGSHTKLTDCCDLRNEALVMGVVDGLGKGQQQSGHQEEYGYHTENNGFCQNDTVTGA